MKSKKFKTARILTIGNELTTGLVSDANSSAIARFLLARGYFVSRMVSVPDVERDIISEARAAMSAADIVVVTGGLGPTHDDITKNSLCKLFKCGTKFQPAVLREVQSKFKKIGIEMLAANRSYAEVPTCAAAVRNDVGIAPGLFFKNKLLVLPGVPREARRMLMTSVPPLIPGGGMHVRGKIFHTAGIGETKLTDEMKGLDKAVRYADVAFLPKFWSVDVRIVARGTTAKKAAANFNAAKKLLLKDISKYVWGTDDETLESVVGAMLRKAGRTLCTAESCTGGGIGGRVTSVAGSSDYFLGGAIVYSNSEKTRQLGVRAGVIKKHGAVSEETAVAMATGACKKFKADFALSSTGVAGPSGGTAEKPVGTVYIALASANGVTVLRLAAIGDREMVRERTCHEALLLLYKALKQTAL